jgi:hypothetical protein
MSTAAVDIAPDERLVIAAQKGDQTSFATLYERYFDSIYDYLVRLTRSRELAADVAQDTFIRAMQKLEQLHEPGAFKGWIYRIARSQALNRLEREGRSIAVAPMEDDEAGWFQVVVASSCCSAWVGFCQPSVCRGRPWRLSSNVWRSSAVWADRSVLLGMYRRRRPLVFSFEPRCQGECGSQK